MSSRYGILPFSRRPSHRTTHRPLPVPTLRSARSGGGLGLFAREDMAAGTVVWRYSVPRDADPADWEYLGDDGKPNELLDEAAFNKLAEADPAAAKEVRRCSNSLPAGGLVSLPDIPPFVRPVHRWSGARRTLRPRCSRMHPRDRACWGRADDVEVLLPRANRQAGAAAGRRWVHQPL